jgi:hypothetical protein
VTPVAPEAAATDADQDDLDLTVRTSREVGEAAQPKRPTAPPGSLAEALGLVPDDDQTDVGPVR